MSPATISKVFCYIRVSSEQQAEGASLSEQRRVIEAFCQRKGLAIVAVIEDVETAAKAGRANFEVMLKKLRKGEAQGVIFHKVDRSSRNYRDWLTISDLMDAGVYIAFAAEGLESKDPSGRFTMDILAATAVHYIRNLREEVKKGIRGRVHAGLFPWPAIFGYLEPPRGTPTADRCLKRPDPERASLLCQMFELYATGEYTLERLAEEMSRRGLRTRCQKPLYMPRVAEMLDNPFYAGFITFDGQLYPGKHEAIVPMALFKRVQALRQKKMHALKSKYDHRFKQTLHCQLCGRMLTAEIQKGHTYYRCHNRSHEPNSVREEMVDNVLGRDLKQVSFSEDEKKAIEVVMKGMVNREQEERQKEKERLLLVQNTAVNKRKAAVDSYLSGVMKEATFVQAQDELLKREKEAEDRLKDLSKHSPAGILAAAVEMFELLFFAYFSADSGKQRQVVRSAYSNLAVAAKNVAAEPKNWLAIVLRREKLRGGGPWRSRTADLRVANAALYQLS